jgi:hypothetical protein
MLFQRDRTVITKHINNIFREGELPLAARRAQNFRVTLSRLNLTALQKKEKFKFG